MRIKVLALTFLLLISADALCQERESINNVDYYLIKKDCHFEFGDTLKRDITSIKSFSNNESEFNQQVVLYLTSEINRRPIKYKLSFFCRKTGSEIKLQWPSVFEGDSAAIQRLLSQKRSPKSIIQEQDAGGRYGRQVNWEKKFAATNWHGTIAYSDKVFGDQTAIPETGYFIACPDNKAVSCFSVEINQTERLKRTDVNKIVDILREVGISM
ncbi:MULTISPECIES: hypothetical protein [Ralstonia]|uniref:hypothetical protein n=1 Tax=Ralstonia TaxID=48736 RepID=UPI0011AFB3F2|nr:MULTISPECIES: hypothetical protein [Ralstonia]QIF09757.1 hypothetical protein G5A69_19730 [Ralstonia mannitolilytica]CAJ0730772.1 hypothetical protein R76706_02485 [Ralstonia mannitolilytica]CAJ0780821.1 hypothetical protein R77555_00738 [Ralstonia mannitolilytica]